MISSSSPPEPGGLRHESLHVDAAPLIRHLLNRLGLPALLERRLPKLRGRRRDLPTSTVLCLLLTNLLLAREPLYAIAGWASGFVPEHLGLLPVDLPRLNDDRIGRALDHLFRADRASLLTTVVLNAIRVFKIALNEMHQDTTTITFSGAYAEQPPLTQTNRPTRITRGHNKDHRPDLKQLLYNRTLTADGGVPIHCKVHDGNTADGKVHKRTWLELCALVGSADFLYVADSKLCDRRTLGLIAKRHGRFLTVLPRTRKEHERFLAWVQHNEVKWAEVCRRSNPRGKDKPQIVYRGYEDEQKSKEGYRIVWYHSSQKKERDYQTRMKRLHKARKRLLQLRPPGRGKHFKSEQAAQEAAQRVVEKYGVQGWLDVTISEKVLMEHEQVGSGRPGPDTLYRQVEVKYYTVEVGLNGTALQRAARCDGLFALMSNDSTLTVVTALQKYKYQPFAEKRHQQLKSVFGVRPVWLKNAKRIESLLWVYHLVELVQALLEREVRRRMVEEGIESLPLRPENRPSTKPTSELIIQVLQGRRRHRLVDATGQEVYCFHDPLSEVARSVFDLLGIDGSAYGLTE